MKYKKELFAAAFALEFQRLTDRGITPGFQVGYPYNGITGDQAWKAWCAECARDYAMGMLKAYETARKVWGTSRR